MVTGLYCQSVNVCFVSIKCYFIYKMFTKTSLLRLWNKHFLYGVLEISEHLGTI